MRAPLVRLAILIYFVNNTLAQGPAPGPAVAPGNGPAPARSVNQPVQVQGPFSVRAIPPWGAVRTGAQPILGWSIGISLRNFPQLLFADVAVKADALGVAAVAGSDRQQLSLTVRKNLGGDLAAGEQNELQTRLRDLRLQMPVLRVADIGSDENHIRRVFEFSRKVGIQTVASERIPQGLQSVESLANEYGINVAICGDLHEVMTAIAGRGKRIGVCGDTGGWMEAGLSPLNAVGTAGDRLLTLNVRDRTALGSGGKPARLGTGAGHLPEFFQRMYQMKITPSLITVSAEATGDPWAELARNLGALEKVIQPAMANRVNEMWNSTPIKGADRLPLEQRQKIEEAVPSQAAARPKKARKLLVVDVNIGYGGARGGHASIPAANLSVELMGKRTGAWETVFSNDIGNFKYEKLKEFDAVFLNNTVGMLFEDAEVRSALLRYVREGGGLAAYHASSHNSMDWPEFGEMLGARQENTRTEIEQPKVPDPLHAAFKLPLFEILTVKLDDPRSPLNQPFGGKGFVWSDEFYRFYEEPYSRDKLHVLLSVDTQATDMAQGVCNRNQWEHSRGCQRADNDYPVAWIRSYGKGRVFYNELGHDMTLFMSSPMVDHFLRGIQFALGDLDADTTPSGQRVSK